VDVELAFEADSRVVVLVGDVDLKVLGPFGHRMRR
jgi:hypothetical protein